MLVISTRPSPEKSSYGTASRAAWQLVEFDSPEQAVLDQFSFQPPDAVDSSPEQTRQMLDGQTGMTANKMQQLLTALRAGAGHRKALSGRPLWRAALGRVSLPQKSGDRACATVAHTDSQLRTLTFGIRPPYLRSTRSSSSNHALLRAPVPSGSEWR